MELHLPVREVSFSFLQDVNIYSNKTGKSKETFLTLQESF